MTLIELAQGEWGRIDYLEGDEKLCRRLLECGFTPGEPVRCVATSLFHDPLAVNVRGALFALRSDEAACIKICPRGRRRRRRECRKRKCRQTTPE